MTELFLLACTAVLTVGYVATLIGLLRHEGPTFKTGFLLGVLFLIFPPLWVLVGTGKLRVLTPFAPMALQDVVLDRYLGEVTLLLAYLMVMLAALLLGAAVSSRRQPVDSGAGLIEYDWLIFALCYLGVTIGFAVASGVFQGGHWYRSRETFLRESSSGVFFAFAAWALRFLVVACAASRVATRRWSWAKGLGLLACVACVELTIVGNRVFILMAAAVVALTIVGRSGLMALLWFSMVAAPVGYAMVVYQEIRAMLFSASPAEMLATLVNAAAAPVRSAEEFLLGVTESINLNVVLQAFHDYGSRFDYLRGATLAKIFLVWIPRAVWPDKPLPITEYAGAAFGPNANVAPVTTIIGEFNMNFGPLSLVLLPAFLFVIVVLSRRLERDPIQRYLLTAFGFLVVRLAVSDMLLATGLALAGYRLLREFTGRRTTDAGLASAAAHGIPD